MSLSPERQAIVDTAENLLGCISMKYVNGQPEGGMSPEGGFDCSGFVRYVLTQSGLNVPPYLGFDGAVHETRHANELWDHYGILVHAKQARPGDLVFFSREGWWPTHVGIYTGSDQYIHAPGKDSTVVRREGGLEQLRPIPQTVHRRYRRLYDFNPIGYKAPAIPHGASYRITQTPLA